ncbi:MAG: DUF4380 domain-containing protein [Chloroflexota bacterium]
MAQQKRALGFPLWGGDKTWLAPQARWRDNAPFFDLDSGPYDLNLDAEQADLIQITMSSRMCRESGMQVRRTVRVSADLPGWTVRHEMRNVSTHPAEWELWDVAMVGRPGVVYLPRSAGSAYPEGVRTYDHEGSSANVRERVVRTMGTVASVDCRQSAAFKFGVDGSEGWIAAVIEQPDGTLIGYRKEVPVYPNGAYAHGCVAEVYNSNGYAYFEIELHGPTVELQPGEHFAIEEQQCVADVHRWPATGAEARAVGIAQ